ncbi:ADP-ribosylglycohydrolase family protein [Kitasatospora griseola]|uniref:ADP-ribosylglycohydrolase family protein n=1 Tax=Kitasatospora griseola TaxID=2064 RepID=UPI0007C715D4|nr:ADP-ribosylglycohydrolase family protein [Kitasatospora griseola]
MTTPAPHTGPAFDALQGLSVGDALGAQFFVPATARAHFSAGTVPPGPWPWTDDTEMACSVYAAQTERGAIDSYDLTHAFAYRHDFDRGYGPAANRLLRLIREGGDARRLAAELFDGQGSFGNGAAMRVAPLGAAYAEDPAAVVRPAADTAVITHTHPDAVDGAIAVAVAAAHAVRCRTEPLTAERFLSAVAGLTPYGVVRDGLYQARQLLDRGDAREVAAVLGNGSRTSALDTVPFALWCAARWLDDYPTAVRAAIGAGGDMDTVAAITGGVVAARTGAAGIPAAWLEARELLPGWAFPAPGGIPAPLPHLTRMRLPRPHPVPEAMHFPEEQWNRYRAGYRAARWVARAEEGVLHLHFAVSGDEVAAIRVVPSGSGQRAVGAEVESHPSHYNGARRPGALLATVMELEGRLQTRGPLPAGPW